MLEPAVPVVAGQEPAVPAEIESQASSTLKKSQNANRTTPKPMRRWLIGLLVIIGCVGLYLFFSDSKASINPLQSLANKEMQSNLDQAIEFDHRNAGIEVSVYYRDAFSKSVVVFDLQAVSGQNSRLDVFRVLLEFAEQMEDSYCDTVELAFRGERKFKIDGSYFRRIGRERDFQNPVYTLRTFPENLKTPSGSRAYSEWTGGVLGVLQRQMDDFNDFHDKWYLNDMLRGMSSTGARTGSDIVDIDITERRQLVVTKAEYNRIQNGMSYREVRRIIGSPGEELSRNFFEGVPSVVESIETVMYSWQNQDGSNMNAMFQNDSLIQKAQFGLR